MRNQIKFYGNTGMRREDIIPCIAEWFENHFQFIQSAIWSGHIKLRIPCSFPNHLRFGESNSHFAIEFTGATEIDKLTEFKIYGPRSSERYKNISSFILPGWRISKPKSTIFQFSGCDVTIHGLTIGSECDTDELSRRFGINATKPRIQGDFETALSFGDDNKTAVISDVDVISRLGTKLFYKYISLALIFKKSISKDELYLWLDSQSTKFMSPPSFNIFGINNGYKASKETFANQLLSLSHQDINEPVIDRFIKSNSAYFAEALGYKTATSQVSLVVKDGHHEEGVLKPDYLMQRQDNHSDITDLKRALVDRVVVGKKSRLRFSGYVNSLIAQLGQYRRYFSTPLNAEWAKKQRGVSVADDLPLIGIVGNDNNVTPEDIEDALSVYDPNITIISYATLVNLLRQRRS